MRQHINNMVLLGLLRPLSERVYVANAKEFPELFPMPEPEGPPVVKPVALPDEKKV